MEVALWVKQGKAGSYFSASFSEPYVAPERAVIGDSMDDDHLEAVLDYGGADWHMDLIRKEIEYRKGGCACYGSNEIHECNCK